MAEKAYTFTIGPVDRIRNRIQLERDTVVDFVVQYETFFEGEFKPVVRYDGSHGHGHRDLLNHRGEVDKHWLPEHMTMGDCLTYAQHDLRDNWEQYRNRFLERYK